jgi:hypothetical protein
MDHPYEFKGGYIIKNLQLERRPCWVVQTTQLDKNYVYGRRVWYVDKEMLYLHHLTTTIKRAVCTGPILHSGLYPEMGIYNQTQALNSTISILTVPCV